MRTSRVESTCVLTRLVRLRDVAQARGLADLVVERHQRVAEAEHADDDHESFFSSVTVRAALLVRRGSRRCALISVLICVAHLRKFLPMAKHQEQEHARRRPRPCRSSHRRRTARAITPTKNRTAIGATVSAVRRFARRRRASSAALGREFGSHVRATGPPAASRTCGTAPATAASIRACPRLPTAWPAPWRRRRGCT